MTNEKMGKTEKNRVVLAYGEVTGHAHAFYGEDTVELEGNKLTVKKTDALKHEEHKEHILNPGIGTVTIQREYSMGSLKRVVD